MDLSKGKVEDYVYGIVDKLLKENGGMGYLKWDWKRGIRNMYCCYVKGGEGGLYIDDVGGV